MKRIWTVTALFLCLLVVTSSTAYSQFRLSLGPTIGMNFNLHTGSDLKESGSGLGMVIGAQVDMNFSNTIGLITNLQFYDNRYGSRSEDGTDLVGGEPVNYTVENNASIAYLGIEPLIKIGIPGSNFFFFGGPAVGFTIQNSGEAITTITTPGFAFNDNTTKRTSKFTIKETNVRFEIKAGAGFDIPIGTFMSITPQVSFGYGITNVVSNVSWKILTIQALATFKFRLV